MSRTMKGVLKQLDEEKVVIVQHGAPPKFVFVHMASEDFGEATRVVEVFFKGNVGIKDIAHPNDGLHHWLVKVPLVARR